MPTQRSPTGHAAATPVSVLTGASSSATSTSLKKRVPRSARDDSDEKQPSKDMMSVPDEERPLLDGATPEIIPDGAVAPGTSTWARRNQWIFFALASGACAACNGVFAKLTTTELTAKFSLAIARLFGLESAGSVVELILRCTFFGLNLALNGVMWTLFTTALARGNSTTQVSIMNTSSNFVLTAALGFLIFSEALPLLWWLGASMIVAGNVIIGRKDEALLELKEGGEEVVVVDEEEEEEDAGQREAVVDEVGAGTEQGAGTLARQANAHGGLEEEEEEKDEDLVDLGTALEGSQGTG